MVEYVIAAGQATEQGGGYGVTRSLDQWATVLNSPTALLVTAALVALVVWALR
jgi:hypothetical protein